MHGYGSLSVKPRPDRHNLKIKNYQGLCHEIMYVIQNQTFDDMSRTIFTLRTRLR